MITRRVTPPRNVGGASPGPPAPAATQLLDEMMYKGHRIELGSYAVGAAWSPRAVVSVRTDEGSWQPTPLYATSSAKFPTRHEADRSALDVARVWIDRLLAQQRASDA